MEYTPLDNYLEMYREAAGFTQEEVACLLGSKAGSKVARYESGIREPNLETALAYEVIFGLPLRELFAGRFEKVKRTVRRRAEHLEGEIRRLEKRNSYRKLASLLAIFSSHEREE